MNTKLRIYFIAVGWFVLSLFSSAANDIISKYLGLRLHPVEVTFFRFLFGSITLLPFILYHGRQTLKTSNPIVHISRGALLFFGMTAWNFGLNIAPVTTATVISWSIPLITLVLAVFFLSEKIIWQRWLVTIIGLIGIIITLKPNSSEFNPSVLIFVLAAISFSALDIINKKFIVKESMLSMLFYSALVTAILALLPTISCWQTPNLQELTLLFILGASANLILFFILKAFALIDITAIAPYRYLELIISSLAAYFVFNELPEKATLYGALVLIPSTLFIIYSEKKVISEDKELIKDNGNS